MRSQTWRALVVPYGIMMCSVALVMLLGFFAISRAVNVVSESRSAIDATHAETITANDVLGYAVGIKRLDSRDVPSQFVVALRDALTRARNLHDSAPTPSGLTSSARQELDRASGLFAQRDAAFEDFATATKQLLDALAPSAAPLDLAPALPVGRLATTEAAYEDALRNVAAFYTDRLAQATAAARLEEALLTLAVILLVGLEIAFIVAPAHRAHSRRLERSVRKQEQDARLSAEIARDIAERDQRDSEAHFNALFRETAIGVALTDRYGNILESNPALRQILGYNANELRTHRFGQWVKGESESAPWPDTEWTGALPGNAPRETEYVRKDGSRVWVEESVSRVVQDGEASVWISMAQDISSRKEAEERLRRQASTDALTRLPNLGAFHDAIERAFRRATIAASESFAVLVIDLDRFKYVNDSRGHRFGDAVLAEVGREIARWARPCDFVARVGGDEFTALLGGVSEPAVALRQASELLRILEGPVTVNGALVAVPASIGICVWSPTFRSADDLLQAADAAAYRAKTTGRARCAVFDAQMAASSRAMVGLAEDLQVAIQRGELWLAYQPIFKLDTRRCIGFEALLRWAHPKLGEISPRIFVPVAEESGFIEPIGQWVIRQACSQLAEWRDRHQANGITMNVNLSAQQLANPKLLPDIISILRETQLPGSALSLELTESMMLESTSMTKATLDGLHQQRVRMVLDDFGTGYSSLGYFHNLPVDGLKIDKSFIIGNDGRLAAPHIVRALVGLAGPLGIDVVAEGVESTRQAEELAEVGCGLGQGFLLSRPLDAESASEFLVRSTSAESPVLTLSR